MIKTLSIITLLLSCLLYNGCAVNPATGENQIMLVSSSQEAEMGRQYAPEVEKQLGGRISNSALQNYVSSVGQRIARVSHLPNSQFSYTAVNDDSINAMALPGGYIFITKGLLSKLNSEAQLAGILGHETAHVTARHAAQAMTTQIGMDLALSVASDHSSAGAAQMANIGSQLISLRYSREHENQADSIGMDYMVRAGYSPNAMIETMEILERESQSRSIEFFSTHPNPGNRKQTLQEQIYVNNYPSGKTGDSDYKQFVLNNL
ncbi:MAG: M48 family metalloprotease [Sedimentisphaerales bacterium]|nr:M48 family metalloprotease [Sedimentisphaerales bacterium]